MSPINDALEAIINTLPTVQPLPTCLITTSQAVLTSIAANVATSAIGTLIKSARRSRRAAKGRKGTGPRHRK